MSETKEGKRLASCFVVAVCVTIPNSTSKSIPLTLSLPFYERIQTHMLWFCVQENTSPSPVVRSRRGKKHTHTLQPDTFSLWLQITDGCVAVPSMGLTSRQNGNFNSGNRLNISFLLLLLLLHTTAIKRQPTLFLRGITRTFIYVRLRTVKTLRMLREFRKPFTLANTFCSVTSNKSDNCLLSKVKCSRGGLDGLHFWTIAPD